MNSPTLKREVSEVKMPAEKPNQQKRDLIHNYLRLYYKLNFEDGDLSLDKTKIFLPLM